MRAAVDVGTNTVRLLLGEVRDGRVRPVRYHRRITRLGGDYSPAEGLSPVSMERTLSALLEFAGLLESEQVSAIRAVGTEALRRAVNGPAFVRTARDETGLPLEIVDGEEEARLCAAGVMAALSPRPEVTLIFDIGGGSTEFVLCRDGDVLFQRSYPVGAVSLCEECPDSDAQRLRIAAVLDRLTSDLEHAGLRSLAAGCELIGTAGTVTTLAALQLGMTDYDWRRVNNLRLTREQIDDLSVRLAPLSVHERERLPGMEAGRGDLILPGLRTVQAVMTCFPRSHLIVSDFGLLEGLLLAND